MKIVASAVLGFLAALGVAALVILVRHPLVRFAVSEAIGR